MIEYLQMNKIHIALASDNNYFEGLLTTAWSMAYHCSDPENIVFHILDGGISNDNWDFLLTRLHEFGCQIDRQIVDQNVRFNGFKCHHGGRMTYARLLLPELLPNVGQIVYSDVDILWLADVAELWASLNPDGVLHYVKDTVFPRAEAETTWLKENRLAIENRFCAGMIVMNLCKFRDEKLHMKMMDMLIKHDGHIPDNDETVLNVFMFGRQDAIPIARRWQCISRGNDDFDSRGYVLHFADDAPWRNLHTIHHMLTNQILSWHKYHAKARQTTTWRSLRQFHSVFDILFCRILYLCAVNCGFIKSMLHLFLTIRGREDGIHCIDQFTVKYPNLPISSPTGRPAPASGR